MHINEVPVDDPHAALERLLIADYLRERGYTLESVRALQLPEAVALLAAATRDASLRLADIEAKAHYASEIHHPS